MAALKERTTKTGLPYGALSGEARRRKTTPQYLQQLAYVADGRCAQCGRKREKGYTWFCRAHADVGRQRYAERREAGQCVTCGADGAAPHARCEACRKKRWRH